MKKKHYLRLCNQAQLEGYAACYGNRYDIDGNSISPEKGFLVPLTSSEYPAIDPDVVASFIKNNRNMLYKNGRCLLIYEQDEGSYSLSVCDYVEDKRNAVFVGLFLNKKCIFDNQLKQPSYKKR